MTPQQLKQQLQYEAAVSSAHLGKIILGDERLYEHQIELLGQMDSTIYPDSLNYNTASMWPTKSGLTTVLVIRAVHHMLFRPQQTAVFLLNDAKSVKEFNTRVEAGFKAVVKFFDLPITDVAHAPGKLTVKPYSIAAVKVSKGENVTAVYIDSPSGIDSRDTLEKVSVAARTATTSDSVPRFHIMSTGYHNAIDQAITSGNVKGVPFWGKVISFRDTLDNEELTRLVEQLGVEKFQTEYMCKNPSDKNAFAHAFSAPR